MKIYDWLESVRFENHQEISIGKYSGTERPNSFHTSANAHTSNDWIQALREIPEISCVTSLEVNCKDANWNNEVLELSNRVFPNLQKLQISVKASKEFSIILSFPNLTELILIVMEKPNDADISFQGNLSSLELFTLQHSGKVRIHSASLANLLVKSESLKYVHLYCKESWYLAENISEKYFQENRREKPVFCIRRSIQESNLWSYTTRTEEEKRLEWVRLQKCWMLYSKIDFASAFSVCTDREKFLKAIPFIDTNVEELDLSGEIHSYLLREPELLQCFSKVKTFRVIHAHELTTKNFEKICQILPNLTCCVFYNNHNPEFRSLIMKSNTLKELHLTHFHCLEVFEILSTSLEILELDNCSDYTFAQYPQVDNRWCNGFFGEKFLSALLNGDKSLSIPHLKYLHIWHNSNGFGPPLVYENQRRDIECIVGHATLEELHISRLSHIRKLTLKNLPNLKSLSINDDFKEGQGWMEFLDIAGLPKDCKFFMEGNLGTTKVSKHNWEK